MAHKGKLWRLAFSRDIALGLTTYATAFGHAYDVTIFGTAGIVGGPCSGLVVRCTEEPRVPANLVRWSSPHFTIFGHDVQYFLDAAVVNLPQVMRVTLSVSVNLITTAFRQSFDRAQGAGWQGLQAFGTTDPPLLVPPWFLQGSTGPPDWSGIVVGY